jgi:hypothetical protein
MHGRSLLLLAFVMATAHVLHGQGGRILSSLPTIQTKIEHKIVCEEGVIYRKPGLPPLKGRGELGALLESEVC